MSKPYGHGIQYLQSLHGTVGYELSRSAVFSRKSNSSSVRLWRGEKVLTLSWRCSMYVIPLSTLNTPGCEPAKRKAQDAILPCGLRVLSLSAIWSGTFANLPPRSGSITREGIPLLSNSACRYDAFVFLLEA